MAIISNKVNERQRTDMKKVKIISDSTCDLSKELLEKYDISILPLHIVLGDKEYTDGVDITPEEIYKWSDKNKTTPKTSAPSMIEAVELMRPYLEEGRDCMLLYIGKYVQFRKRNASCSRRTGSRGKVTVIDSKNLSTGIGHLL